MTETLDRALYHANNTSAALHSVLDYPYIEWDEHEIEQAVIAALDANMRAYHELTHALEVLPDSARVLPCKADFDGDIPSAQVSFIGNWQCHCRIDAPPILKHRSGKHKAAAAHYIDAVAEALMRKLIKNISPEFRKLRSAYIIYVSHIVCGKTARSAYFDNDNLAIKGLLDAIVPLVCVDDAAIYCDNLYLVQPSTDSYVDIYIVEKPRLREWIQMHPELDFANSILGNREMYIGGTSR